MTMLHYVCLCSNYRKIVTINMLFSIVHQVFWVLSKQDTLKMVTEKYNKCWSPKSLAPQLLQVLSYITLHSYWLRKIQ